MFSWQQPKSHQMEDMMIVPLQTEHIWLALSLVLLLYTFVIDCQFTLTLTTPILRGKQVDLPQTKTYYISFLQASHADSNHVIPEMIP